MAMLNYQRVSKKINSIPIINDVIHAYVTIYIYESHHIYVLYRFMHKSV